MSWEFDLSMHDFTGSPKHWFEALTATHFSVSCPLLPVTGCQGIRQFHDVSLAVDSLYFGKEYADNAQKRGVDFVLGVRHLMQRIDG